MLDKGKNIDSLFKDGLKDLSMPPRPDIWDNISSALDANQKKKRLLIWWQRGAAAAIIGLIATTISYITYQTNSTSHNTAQSTTEQSEIESLHANSVQSTSDQKVEIPKLSKHTKQNKAPVLLVSSTPKAAEIKNNIDTEQILVPFSKMTAQPLTNIGAAGQIPTSPLITTRNQNRFNLLSQSITPFPTTNNQPKKNKTRILLAGSISPSYSRNQSGGGSSHANANVYAAPSIEATNGSSPRIEENGITSISGGFNVRIENDQRWSIETGILYSKVGQSTKNPTPLVHNSGNQTYSEANILQQVSLSNSIGRIKLGRQDVLLDNAALNSSDNKYLLAMNNTVYSSTNIKQTLEYIEIPLTLRYKLIDAFTSVSLAGGVSSNFLVDNNAYLVDGSQSRNIGETDGIKPVVFSSSLGIGFELPLGKSFRFSLEPRVKYFLNSLNSNSAYSYQPVSLGVYGGIILVIK